MEEDTEGEDSDISTDAGGADGPPSEAMAAAVLHRLGGGPPEAALYFPSALAPALRDWWEAEFGAQDASWEAFRGPATAAMADAATGNSQARGGRLSRPILPPHDGCQLGQGDASGPAQRVCVTIGSQLPRTAPRQYRLGLPHEAAGTSSKGICRQSMMWAAVGSGSSWRYRTLRGIFSLTT